MTFILLIHPKCLPQLCLHSSCKKGNSPVALSVLSLLLHIALFQEYSIFIYTPYCCSSTPLKESTLAEEGFSSSGAAKTPLPAWSDPPRAWQQHTQPKANQCLQSHPNTLNWLFPLHSDVNASQPVLSRQEFSDQT